MAESTENQQEIRRGLAGVVADTTSISKVNPETNSLLYRGYPVQELAASCTFEEVAYLLWHGELPSEEELSAFTAAERAGRALSDETRRAIDLVPVTAHPMDVVRTAVSLVGAADVEAAEAFGEAGAPASTGLAVAQRLWAALPAIVAYDQRRRHGLELVEPRDDLGYAADFLWMTFGEEPHPAVERAFTVSMILYAEHSFNASTFTARVVASTLSDMSSAVTAAIGALKGPLHGGANEAVMHVLREIGSADAAAGWLADALAAGRKIMGFGHRVYKNGDSRVPTMRAALGELAEHYDRPDVLDLYDALESAVAEAKGIKPNLDFPSGPAYDLMGFDIGTFTPLFVASRVVGWSAHVLEQLERGALIRPLSAYDGPEERHVGSGRR